MKGKMKISDLSGLGKPAEKLIDVVSKGIGRIYSDTIGVSAEVRKMKLISRAKSEIQNSELLPSPEINTRAHDRLEYVESKRQLNIESVLSLAYEGLPSNVSDKPVDEDWIARFFDTIKDVSSEDLKVVWAKILAGEIQSPGNFSLRTLDVIKNISPDEAEVFLKLCDVASDFWFVIKPDHQSDLTKYGLNYHNLMIQVECGLLSDTNFAFSKADCDVEYEISYANRCISLTHPKNKKIEFAMLVLSKAGQQLCKLLKREVNTDYFEDIGKHFEDRGYVVARLNKSYPEY